MVPKCSKQSFENIGMQDFIHVHVTGDRAVELTLGMLEKIQLEMPGSITGLPWSTWGVDAGTVGLGEILGCLCVGECVLPARTIIEIR